MTDRHSPFASGNGVRDPHIDALWRSTSTEEPSPAIDDKLLALAHREAGAVPRDASSAEARRPARWWWPLAAAATIGAIAIGVLQLVPVEPSEHDAISDMAPASKRSQASGAPAVAPTIAPAPKQMADDERQGAAFREKAQQEAMKRKGLAQSTQGLAPSEEGLAQRADSLPQRAENLPHRAEGLTQPAERAAQLTERSAQRAEGVPPHANSKLASASNTQAAKNESAPKSAFVDKTSSADAKVPAAPSAPAIPDGRRSFDKDNASIASGGEQARAAPQSAASPSASFAAPGASAAKRMSEAPAMHDRAEIAPGVAPQTREMENKPPQPSVPLAKARAASEASDAAASVTPSPFPAGRVALPVADWIALIRRLRDEGKIEQATKELTAFREAHANADQLLPPDLRDWRVKATR